MPGGISTPTMTTKPKRRPLGGWSGWLVTLFVGVTVSACVGGFFRRAIDAVELDVTFDLREAPLLYASIPITAGCLIARSSPQAWLSTLPRRVLFGFILGTGWDVLLLLIWFPPGQQSGSSLRTNAFSPYLDFAFLEIEVSAMVIAAVARPRWFGVL